MVSFEVLTSMIFSGLRLYENDPGFGHRMYKLKDEASARLFRMARRQLVDENEPPPTIGVFVEFGLHPMPGQFIIYYRHFCADGKADTDGALGYTEKETTKARQHIVQYLTYGKVPVADGLVPA